MLFYRRGKVLTRTLIYKDRKGRQPVLDFIQELAASSGKDARINLKKVGSYITLLDKDGLSIGEPYIKHLKGDIWELRPLRNRILFAALVEGKFVLLHVFLKRTQKTPVSEIEKAERELEDFRRRFEP